MQDQDPPEKKRIFKKRSELKKDEPEDKAKKKKKYIKKEDYIQEKINQDLIQSLGRLQIAQKIQQKQQLHTKNKRQYDNTQSIQREQSDRPQQHYRKQGGWRQQRHEPSYNKKKDPCQKYILNSYEIKKDDHDLGDKIKKLKKIFISNFKKAKEVEIQVSKIYPMILFKFNEDKYQKYMHLRQVMKECKQMKDRRQMFQQIFGRLFKKVGKKYYNLAVFAVSKATQIRVSIKKQSIFNLNEGEEVMFYYMDGPRPKKQLNFITFDRFLRSIQFNSEFIQNKCSSHPQEYKLYQKFHRQVYQIHKQDDDGVDLLNNQQLSSDEERVDFQERGFEQIKVQLTKILNKNYTDLEYIIEEKSNMLSAQVQKNSTSSKAIKLADEIEQLQENYQNYKQTRDQVCNIIQHNQSSNKHKWVSCLKKMIIAEKQLQSKLPIIGKKQKIFQLLRKQQLLIIEGETGSGKSTQLPQMLCEYYQLFDKPEARPVLVTQPRRLATRSLAQRVAKQMGESVGGFVDYVASAGKKVNNLAKIIFKLDRLVLDEITDDPLLSNYSCLVIDEAHQRTISIDVILGLVKKLLSQRKDFKVIVTSASMDIHLFEDYFKTKTLKVSGRMFPVTINYKDYQKFKEGDKYQMVHKIRKVIDEEILYNDSSMKNEFKGHLLCFCSNLDEINQLVKNYDAKLNKNVFSVFALHGKITPADQKKVFSQTGKHKFIFASRIAETAITIDGVRVVIDPGQDFQLVYDQKYKVSTMKLQQITQSSAKQRAGRSGRTCSGYCFRLYSQLNFSQRKVNKMPQIQNSSLQTVVLRLKSLKIDDVLNFPYISKPSLEGLKKSLQILLLIGAINHKDQKISKIGELLIKLPIQPFLSRGIIEALMFQTVFKKQNFIYSLKKLPKEQLQQIEDRGIKTTVLQILALLVNFSNLFFIRTEDREQGQKVKYTQFSDEEGDFFFLDNIFRKYQQFNIKRNKGFKDPSFNTWVRKNYLNFKAFNQTQDLINQINNVVQDFSINQSLYQQELDNIKSKVRQCKTFRQVILSCLITSFSANLCKYSGNPNIGYTIVNQRRPIQIYGTSNLSLLGIQCDWIICYDLYTNQVGRLYCKVAHKISYDFMKNHISKYIWKKFDIEKIQKNNPYYTSLSFDLPTKIFQQFKFDCYKSAKNQTKDDKLRFLNDAFPLFTEEKNNLTFFIETDKNNKLMSEVLKSKINKHITKLQYQCKQQFRHNYIGNIFILFSEGFEIQRLQFTNKQFCIEVVGQNQIIYQIQDDCKVFGKGNVEEIEKDKDRKEKYKRNANQQKALVFEENKKRIKVYILQQDKKESFLEYLAIIQAAYPAYKVEYKETLVDKRRKIPQTKIVILFYAGKCQKDNVLISYSSYDTDHEGNSIAIQQLRLIKNGLLKKSMLNRPTRIKPTQLKLTRAQNGINIYTTYDQFEIAEQLYEMEKNKLLTYAFKFPSYIRKFRQPQISEACKSNDQWRDQIQVLFDKLKIKKQNLTINIRGYYSNNKKKDWKKISQFQKNLRVDLTATITTLDNSILTKLKNAYDGQQNILGCQKMHIRANYDQVIAVPAAKAFDSLYQEYTFHLSIFKIECPLMIFDQIPIRSRNKQKVMIIARSPNRQDFVKPQRILSNLFMNKLIKLQFSEFRFLEKMNKGSQILEKLEKQYNYKIYFAFEKFSNSLKVYCQDSQLKQIQQLIKKRIKQYKFYTEYISYRGKNLNKVKSILQQHTKKQGELLSYEICFQKREILVTADLNTFENIKNDLLKLSNSQKKQCDICADIMRNPFRFINCKCSFCWLCIADHIRNFKTTNQDILACPNVDCRSPINMNDVKTILSEEEFQKICDIKIGKFIEKNTDKYIPCKTCQHIFDKKEVEEAGEINCQICGRSECFKCNQSHPNYTCQQWKDRDNVNKCLSSLGIKKCPQCNNGIQKNGGCNHISCRCGAHICWKCLKVFKQSGKCYDHLAKQCGGIFDANI